METSFFFFFFYFLLFIFFLFLKNYLQKINQKLPPSPSLCFPVVGHLYLLKKPLHRTLAELSNKHEPITYLRFGSGAVLLVSSPSAAEECFTKNDIAFANRPKLLAGKHLGYNHTTLTWASYGSHWRNLRRIASLELLSSNRVQMLSSIRLDEVGSLISGLFRCAKGGNEFQSLDMKSAFFELTLNVLMRMIAGKRCHRETVAELEEIIAENFRLSGATNLGDFLPVLKYVGVSSLEKKLMKLHQKMEKFMQDLIQERREKQSGSVSEQRSKSMVDVACPARNTTGILY